MSFRRLPPLCVLAILLLGSPRPAIAQPLDTPCCTSVEDAREAFERGLETLTYRWRVPGKLDEAGRLLCQAACCLPEPDARVRADLGMLTAEYLPHLHLGLYYKKRNDHCHGLGNFNLSQCRGEVSEGHDRYQDLETWRKQSRRSRPPTTEEFGRGLYAYKERDWEEAIQYLSTAFRAWDDDGEPPRLGGRWPTERPYLPRYFLARALFEDGCVRESIALLRCSQLSRCKLADDPAEDPEAFLAEAVARLKRLAGKPEPETCDRWRDLTTEQGECCSCARCET
jgi:hypothetical protein